MTRKDYILIANALRIRLESETMNRNIKKNEGADKLDLAWLSGAQSGVLAAAEEIAHALGTDNSRFDASHFLAVVRGEKDLNSRPSRRKS